MKHALLTLLSLLLFACGNTTSVTKSEAPASPKSMCCADCIKPNLGKVVEVTGILQNTKLAPSIAANGFNVYCMGAIFQEGDLRVRARGRLENTDVFAAKPIEGQPGVVTQGTTGNDLVLFECTLEVLKDE